MKVLFHSFIVACSMYSKIPMPKTDWKEEYMRYTMCFFPLIGVFIGLMIYGGYWVMDGQSTGLLLKTIFMIVLPLLITGGIHFDGFLDTVDAKSSYKSKEEKLEILKDPHTGAFAIIGASIYFLLSLGIYSEITIKEMGVLCVGYTMSRALSGLGVATFPMAKNTGLLSIFSKGSDKKVVTVVMMIYIISCSMIMCLFDPVYGFASIIVSFLVFFYYYHMSIKIFGGITGDLAGYFLQVCELSIAVALVLVKYLYPF